MINTIELANYFKLTRLQYYSAETILGFMYSNHRTNFIKNTKTTIYGRELVERYHTRLICSSTSFTTIVVEDRFTRQ